MESLLTLSHIFPILEVDEKPERKGILFCAKPFPFPAADKKSGYGSEVIGG